MEVGEYVRTRIGIIDKVVKVNKGKNKPFVYYDYTCEKRNYDEEAIVKHSKNIIDLIEVGDYVNEKRINDIEKFDNGTIYIKHSEHDYICDYQQEKIKSIVTKEQFKSIEYEV